MRRIVSDKMLQQINHIGTHHDRRTYQDKYAAKEVNRHDSKMFLSQWKRYKELFVSLLNMAGIDMETGIMFT